MATTLREAWKRLMPGGRGRHGQRSASFRLQYTPAQAPALTVGYLRLEDGRWFFEYDKEYRRRSDLRPIEGFDDTHKIYSSTSLFPFFAVRIPDEHRSDVRRQLEEHRIQDPDEADLLRVFGRRAAASPAFELIENK